MPRAPATGQGIRKIAWSKAIVRRHDIAALRVDQARHFVIGNDARPLMLRVPAWAVAALGKFSQRNSAYRLKPDIAFGIREDEVERRAQPRSACLAKFMAIAGAIHADRRRQPAARLEAEPAQRHRPGVA